METKHKIKGKIILRGIDNSLTGDMILLGNKTFCRLVERYKNSRALVLLNPDDEDSTYQVSSKNLKSVVFVTGWNPFTEKQEKFEVPVRITNKNCEEILLALHKFVEGEVDRYKCEL
jgi:hypothetical protein